MPETNRISQSIDRDLYALNKPMDYPTSPEDVSSAEIANENSKKAVNPYYQSSVQPFSSNSTPNPTEKSAEINRTIKAPQANIFGGFYNWVKKIFGFSTETENVTNKENDPNRTANPIESKPSLATPSKRLLDAMKETNSFYERVINDNYDFNDPKFSDSMIARIYFELLKTQQKFREKDTALITEKIQDEQESLRDVHQKRMKQKEELASLLKQSKFHAVATPIITAGSIAGFVITGAMAVAGAATIASGGTLAPLLIATSIFSGIFTGLQAVNTYFRNSNEIKLRDHEGVSLKLNEEKNMIEFELKVSLDSMKQSMKNWNELITTMSRVIQRQAEEKINFR